MTNETAHKILSDHQEWRRSDKTLPPMPYPPKLVGEAIDVALEALRGWQRIDEELPPIDAPVLIVELSGNTFIAKRANTPNGRLWSEVRYSQYSAKTKTIEGVPEIVDIEPVYWHPFPEIPANLFACLGE